MSKHWTKDRREISAEDAALLEAQAQAAAMLRHGLRSVGQDANDGLLAAAFTLKDSRSADSRAIGFALLAAWGA